jgi:hypothetical protein
MSAGPATAKAASRARAEVRAAVEQARTAYEFVPNTFTYSCLSACLAAEQALEVLRDHMSDQHETSKH